MFRGILRILGIGALAALVAACTGTTPGPAVESAALPQSTPAIAFEPVTGIPEERSAVLAEALVSGAVSRGIIVVPREEEDALYRVKGYFSAARAGSGTEVSFAWDIFDRDDSRVHRIVGTETIRAAVPDPWRAVTDDALRRVASRTVEDLQAWLSGRASAGHQSSQAPRQPNGSGVTALLGGADIPAPDPSRSGTRVFVGPVQGVAPEGGAALAHAMAAQLGAAGINGAADPADADYLVSGEATVSPVQDAAQTVAIIWSVTRPGGEGLGTVRQVRRLAAGALDSGWDGAARDAAGAAAPGLFSLMQGE